MGKTAGHILKGKNVKLEGQLHLDVVQTRMNLSKKERATLAAPQARIVENQTESAVIEITCSCGTKTLLRCEYAGAASSSEQVVGQTK